MFSRLLKFTVWLQSILNSVTVLKGTGERLKGLRDTCQSKWPHARSDLLEQYSLVVL